jgi:hypothetical protein
MIHSCSFTKSNHEPQERYTTHLSKILIKTLDLWITPLIYLTLFSFIFYVKSNHLNLKPNKNLLAKGGYYMATTKLNYLQVAIWNK